MFILLTDWFNQRHKEDVVYHYRDTQPGNGAVAVVILSPKNEVLLVIQRNRKNPFWKIPVETRRFNEYPVQTATRGAWEELGLNLRNYDFEEVATEDRSVPNHYRPYIFIAFVSQEIFESHAVQGNEDGAVLDIRKEQFSNIYGLHRFLKTHYYIVKTVADHLKTSKVAE